MKKILLLLIPGAFGLAAGAQLHIQSGATFHIQTGTKVTVQGDVTSFADIQGPGTLSMKGTALQNLNMNGFTLQNLEIDNTNNVLLLDGGTRIATNLLFVNGKIQTGSQNLVIAAAATITGQNASRFVWTNGTGELRKELTADVAGYELPVGENTNYRPAYLTTSGSAFSGASVGVRAVSGATPNRPVHIANLLTTYWPVTQTGITGGTVTLEGQYLDPTDVSGTEANLAGYYFDGTDWSSTGGAINSATNRVSGVVSGANGELSGLNRFVLVGARAFLQGAYNATTGLMSEGLRTPSNLIPLSDPYRSAPFNSGAFTHTANTTTEVAVASVFNTVAPAENNIVDWVFLELRNTDASPGNDILQTRSALIQRDGDIVDYDGVSPVTFNNILPGNYTIAIRHRNHLGLSTDQVNNPRALNETKSIAYTTNLVDLRTFTDANLFGTTAAYTTASHPTLGIVNVLWAGNANFNANTRFNGLLNDKDYILVNVLGNSSGITLNNVYNPADLNLNRNVRFNGLLNDKDIILVNVLGNASGITRTQALPN